MRFKLKIPSHEAAKLGTSLMPTVNRAVAAALPKIGTLAVDRLCTEADRVLHRTASEYKRGLQQPESVTVTATDITVTLVTPFAIGLENGWSSFDIKAKMLAKASKFSADGSPYVDVPFRHGLESDATRLPGVPEDIKAKMANAVKREQTALRKRGASREEVATAQARLRIKTRGAEFDRRLTIGGVPIDTHVKHKRGLYDDMLRTARMGKQRAIGQYNTFRRISAKSDAMAWWHPGFQGVKLFPKIQAELVEPAKRIINDSLREAGLKTRVA